MTLPPLIPHGARTFAVLVTIPLRCGSGKRPGDSERSWLAGILKNKIVDRFRKLGRETSFTDMEFLSDELSEKFASVGFWNHDLGPHEWKPEPDAVMHRAEFWQVMGDCLSKLPEKIRAVFTMREMDEVPSKEIAQSCRLATAISG
jgi:DNA-directed RNA polymerase specialized sigma24 family protein